VDTDSRSPLLLTWHRLGAPPYFYIPLSPSFLWQGRALLTSLQNVMVPKIAFCVVSQWTDDTLTAPMSPRYRAVLLPYLLE
jgi:hypothetical protein